MSESSESLSSAQSARAGDPSKWSIASGYSDVHGEWHASPAHSTELALKTLGASAVRSEPGPTPVWVLRRSKIDQTNIPAGLITLEGGAVLEHGGGPLPFDVADGYHQIVVDQALVRNVHESVLQRIFVTPDRCPMVDERGWGWNLQLYALRSETSGGIGDLGVLRKFQTLARAQGASFTLINPLHAASPGLPQQPSPYYASSRLFKNPIYLDVMELLDQYQFGESAAVEDLQRDLNSVSRLLNQVPRIDRDAAWTVKRDLLNVLWRVDNTDIQNHAADWLSTTPYAQAFVAHELLAEQYGADWHKWPEQWQAPTHSAVMGLINERHNRALFHAWLQYELLRQLNLANDELGVMSDLAVGCDPSGAETWIWRDVIALDGTRVGCPPDPLAWAGQDWGVPPFNPIALRDAFYEPFIALLRASMKGMSAMRIDHVMGLFRLFWIPVGADAAHGVYVEYPWWDLLPIIALEAHRNNCVVVGEDLGTVGPEVREALQDHGLLAYRLSMFAEPHEVEQWPRSSLAAVTTHDLPTIAGVVTGNDARAQLEAGMLVEDAEVEGIHTRLMERAKSQDARPIDVVRGLYAELAESPSVLVVATVDDAFLMTDRPNMPGTIDEWPNWRVALSGGVDDFENAPGTIAITEAMICRAKSSNEG